METIKEIFKDDVNQQIKKLTSYCFNDTIGWTDRLFPLYNGDRLWGIFSESELCACVMSRNFKATIYNTIQPMSGIALVASWPDKRNKGLIKKLITEILKTEYTNGKVLSALYPFKFKFYEMFGYGTVGGPVRYNFNPDNLKKIPHPAGEFVRFDQSEKQMADIYTTRDKWAAGYNFGIAALRYPISKFLEDIHWLKDNIYLYYKDKVCKAYVRYKINNVAQYQNRLCISQIAWTDAESLHALFHFMASHRDQIFEVEWMAPPNLPITAFMEDPRIQNMQHVDWMARPMNVIKILECKLKANPIHGKFTFSVQDEIIRENNATYTIEGDTVKREKYNAATPLSLPVFSTLLFGGISLEEAELTGLLNSTSPQQARSFFRRDYNLCLTDHF